MARLSVFDKWTLSRKKDDHAPPFIDPRFKAQAAFADDPSRKKFAFCTRRAGKSEGLGRLLLREAYENPDSQCLYVGLTRPSAKAIMWTPILKRLCREWGLDAKFNETELTVTLPNRGVIRLTGADANDGERNKLLGQRNRIAALDECASFRRHIRELVYDVVRPTLLDERGTLIMAGTPGEVPAGLFYDITTGDVGGWSGHRWTTADNPFMREQYLDELKEFKIEDPDVESRPWFRRQYLGEWVVDSDTLVYGLNGSNLEDVLPEGRWEHTLGIDLGWNDDTSFTLGAWSSSENVLHIIESWKRPKLTFDDVAAIVRDYQETYDIMDVVVDNANKQGIESMQARHGINFTPSAKSGKSDYIGLFNSDLAAGRIKVVGESCAPLLEEWANLVWDKDRSPPREHPRCANHCADSALYMWRQARNYLHQPTVKPPRFGDSRYPQYEANQIEEEEDRQWEKKKRTPWIDTI